MPDWGPAAAAAVPVAAAWAAFAVVPGGACRTSTQSGFPALLLPDELYVVPEVTADVAPEAGSTQVAVYPAAIFDSSIVIDMATAQ